MSLTILIYSIVFILGLAMLASLPKLYNHLNENEPGDLNPFRNFKFLFILGLALILIVVGWTGTDFSSKEASSKLTQSLVYSKLVDLNTKYYAAWSKVDSPAMGYPEYFKTNATKQYPEFSDYISKLTFIKSAAGTYLIDQSSLLDMPVKKSK